MRTAANVTLALLFASSSIFATVTAIRARNELRAEMTTVARSVKRLRRDLYAMYGARKLASADQKPMHASA